MDAAFKGLVRAAVFLGRSDGRLHEQEVERLIDGMRALAVTRGEPSLVKQWASLAAVIDEARAARAALRVQPQETYLTEVASLLDGQLTDEALTLALSIARADATVASVELGAYLALARALGVSEEVAAAIAART